MTRPRISPRRPALRPADGLPADLAASVRGDVWLDRATRAIYATDASNYRHVPAAVVCPADADDVVAAVQACRANGVPVTPRGAGTSLAGQATSTGVVLDTSRHLRQILEIDPERRLARVQPGVVLDDLRAAAERTAGLTFGPDPATHAWCTLGGMLGTNACGTHGLVAGRTSDNVESLRVVTYGGETLEVGAGIIRRADGSPDTARMRALEAIVERHGAIIRSGYPSLGRRVSGYGLDDLLPERGFQVARALVGTEGTCVIVTEATLRLVHLPPRRRLVVLPYPDVFAAADAVPELIRRPLIGLEGFDAELVRLMRARPLHLEHLRLLPEGGAWLYAEVAGETDAEADEAAAAFVASLPAGQEARIVGDPADQARLWLIRESALGATAIRPDGRHNREGWEDAAVPPERLGEYLRALTGLWARFGYSGALYGHFGQGCVHTRNDFDFETREGVARYRGFVEAAADLVVSLGGSLSGEHGDGRSRGELLARMYDPELLEAFREFRAVWDPDGAMNPGTLVDPEPLDASLRWDVDGHGTRERLETARAGQPGFAFGRDGGSLAAAAERCVGVGRCRRDTGGVMCPSYRATRDPLHGTRGRATILAELFRGDATPATWRNEDVREALDLCLSCKGCAVDCPTGVDVAAYKAEFLHHHYRGRLRPRAAYSLGLIPLWARLAAPVPRLADAALSAPLVGTIARRIAGVTDRRPVPRFMAPWRRSATARVRRDAREASVVVWPDTFSDAFRPAYAEAVVRVLEAAGERVAVPGDWACCGRPLYDSGMLGVARRWVTRLVEVLDPWTSRGIPVVVPEPSCLAAFRDEVPALLPDDPRAARLASLARSPAEHLVAGDAAATLRERLAGPGVTTDAATELVIHPHCHARASGAAPADAALARALGFEVRVVDGGCCGLAGSFGYRREHEAVSRAIGEEQWLPAVDAATRDGGQVVIDGFSCGLQWEHLGRPAAPDLVTLIADRLAGATQPPAPGDPS